jgi:WD40 repeat protein
VYVWDVKTGVPYGSPLAADTTPVSDVRFSADGRSLVSSHLRSAVIWNIGGDQALGSRSGGPADLITEMAFSPNAAGSSLRAGSTEARSCTTRRLGDSCERIDGDSVVTAVAFRPNGKLIAVGTTDGPRAVLRSEDRGRRRLCA